ncbi:MAG TPA: hypothetical protein VMY77_03490 [Chitinophagaceae bacterium]|nr:hypothetical protein [Chitinophagaceae bacterium]
MKANKLIRIISLVMPVTILFICIGCKKEPVNNFSTTTATIPSPILPPTSPPPVIPVNTAPNVFAGSDIYLVLPVDSCTLKGSAQYPQSIETTLWNKISGPGSFFIENPNLFETKVRSLEKGIYFFEVTVTDRVSLTGKDTVSVSVLETGSGKNELIFKDLRWSCPMGCHMRIENFHSFVPTGTAFKAYVKRDNSTEWVEVVNMSKGIGKYMWTIYNGGLEIPEDQTEPDPNDTPDVKIIF